MHNIRIKSTIKVFLCNTDKPYLFIPNNIKKLDLNLYKKSVNKQKIRSVKSNISLLSCSYKTYGYHSSKNLKIGGNYYCVQLKKNNGFKEIAHHIVC